MLVSHWMYIFFKYLALSEWEASTRRNQYCHSSWRLHSRIPTPFSLQNFTDVSEELSVYKVRDPATRFFFCRYYYHKTWRHSNVYSFRSENFTSDVIMLVYLHSRRKRIFKLCQFHQHIFFCRLQKTSYVKRVF